MADRPLRPCKKMGCSNLTRDISGYCEKHRYIYEEKQKERWKYVDKVKKAEADRNRKSARERGYDTRWDKARKGYLFKHPLCAECLKKDIYTPATVVDHIIPHRGDKKLFWDSSNWQPLCKHHHDMKTARGQ